MHKQSKLQGHATYTSLQYYEWYTDGQQAVKRYLNTGKSTKITYRVTDEGNLSSFRNTAFFHTQLIESHVIVTNRMPKGKKNKTYQMLHPVPLCNLTIESDTLLQMAVTMTFKYPNLSQISNFDCSKNSLSWGHNISEFLYSEDESVEPPSSTINLPYYLFF